MSHTRLPFGLTKNKAALIIIGAAILVFVILKATKPTAQVQASVESVYSVRAMKVTPAALSPSLRLYGTVIAPGRAALSAAVSANVTKVHALAGERVEAGDLLIELDAAEAEIAVAQAQAGMQQAEAQLSLDRSRRATDRAALAQERELLTLAERAVTRALNLRKQGLLSEAEVDATKQNLQKQRLSLQQRELAVQQADAVTRQRQAEMASAEARLQRAELDLQRTQITAPFSAAVIATHVAIGDRVNPGSPLIALYDLSRVEVQAQIPSRFLPTLEQARIEKRPLRAIAMSAGQEIPAQFLRLASSAGGGGQDAYFSLSGDGLPVDSKLTLELELPPQDNAIALPFDAIYDLSRIFRVRDGRLESVAIEKLGDYVPADGSPTAQLLLVRSTELQAGDVVMVSQLPNAVTGLKVQTILP